MFLTLFFSIETEMQANTAAGIFPICSGNFFTVNIKIANDCGKPCHWALWLKTNARAAVKEYHTKMDDGNSLSNKGKTVTYRPKTFNF